MTVQYAELREKVGKGELELSDLDEVRNTATTAKERAAVAVLVDKVKAGKVDADAIEALGLAYPEKKSEKRVEKLEAKNEAPAQSAAEQRSAAKQEPVKKDVAG